VLLRRTKFHNRISWESLHGCCWWISPRVCRNQVTIDLEVHEDIDLEASATSARDIAVGWTIVSVLTSGVSERLDVATRALSDANALVIAAVDLNIGSVALPGQKWVTLSAVACGAKPLRVAETASGANLVCAVGHRLVLVVHLSTSALLADPATSRTATSTRAHVSSVRTAHH
jgi:hypothetical protein